MIENDSQPIMIVKDKYGLSDRESKYLFLRLQGHTNESCAKLLDISIATIYRMSAQDRLKLAMGEFTSVILQDNVTQLGTEVMKAIAFLGQVVAGDTIPIEHRITASKELLNHYQKLNANHREQVLFDKVMEQLKPKELDRATGELSFSFDSIE